MNRIQRLLKLHKLFKPADENGSDTGGTDTAVVDSDDDLEVDLGAVGDQDGAGSDDAGADGDTGAGGEGDDDVVVTIGGEAVDDETEDVARAPEWVRDLRKQNREKDRVIRDLQQKVAAATPAPQAVTLGVKPTLESSDYNETKYETDLEAWHARKREVEDQQRTRDETEKKSRDAWQSKLNDYSKAKTALKVKDFVDAEDSAKEIFSVVQQGVILNGAENAAVLIYALGKNPKKAKEMATITDPVKFAFAVAKLETQLKVTPRKLAPTPERTVRGGATGAAIDSALSRLEAEADKTGDRTKVAAYHRNKKLAQRAA